MGKFPLRCISLVLVHTFIFQDLLFAAGASPAPLSPISIPAALGSTTPSGPRGSHELVIHIQDAHAKLGAQESITGILDRLVKNYDLRLVALEGASGTVDTSLLSRFPDEDVRRDTGGKLLAEGRISAGEYYSIISGGAVRLYGAEDEELYQRNAQTFRGLVDAAPQIRREMKQLRESLALLEEKVYSKELAEVQRRRLPRGSADISFEEYWHFTQEAVSRQHIDLKDYPHLSGLERLFAMERGLHFADARGNVSS